MAGRRDWIKRVLSLAFPSGLAMFAWIDRTDSGVQKRVQFAKAVQIDSETRGSDFLVVDEETPVSALRIQHAGWSEADCDRVARSLIAKSAARMLALGYQQLQLTDGFNIRTYTIH